MHLLYAVQVTPSISLPKAFNLQGMLWISLVVVSNHADSVGFFLPLFQKKVEVICVWGKTQNTLQLWNHYCSSWGVIIKGNAKTAVSVGHGSRNLIWVNWPFLKKHLCRVPSGSDGWGRAESLEADPDDVQDARPSQGGLLRPPGAGFLKAGSERLPSAATSRPNSHVARAAYKWGRNTRCLWTKSRVSVKKKNRFKIVCSLPFLTTESYLKRSSVLWWKMFSSRNSDNFRQPTDQFSVLSAKLTLSVCAR